MKKTICVLQSVIILMLCFSSCASKEAYEYYGMTFEETAYRKLTLTKYSGDEKNVEIPENIKGIDVVSIGVQAFEDSQIESVLIPNTTEKIDGAAFKNCKNLKEITFGYGVKDIGDWAFYGCESLENVTFPDNIKTIGEAAFAFSGITGFDLGSGDISIGKQAFYSCDNLKYADIKANVKELGEQAFFNCTGLTTVYIAPEVTNIGKYAVGFRQNKDNEIEAAKHTFICGRPNTPAAEYANANKISFLTLALAQELDYSISGNDIRISEYTGTETNFVIPASLDGKRVIGIDSEAFANNLTVESIVLPETVTEIGEAAFCGCTNLGYIYIPKTVKYIGGGAFSETLWLNLLTDEFVVVGDGILIDYNGEETEVTVPDGIKLISGAFNMNCDITSVKIPNTVTNIGGWSFLMCEKLANIEMPNSVTVIENKAFSWCRALESITLGKGVTKIDEKAFFACNKLSHITLPEGLISVGEGAFEVCPALLSVSIPSSVTEIADNAFDKKTLTQIYGQTDSVAHKYAEKISVEFIET